MAKEIEISKTGIKFSYHRFVADSAPGFVLILIFLFFDKKYTLNVFVDFEKRNKVLIGILLRWSPKIAQFSKVVKFKKREKGGDHERQKKLHSRI